jgi:diguanylate cyclase (GGDEF)-like protein
MVRCGTDNLVAKTLRTAGAAFAVAALAAMPLLARGATHGPAVDLTPKATLSNAKQEADFTEDAAEVVFEHLSDSTGLANPVVTSFAQDGDGFLWVGSQSGVQRWDGYRFWNYKTMLGDEKSLPDTFVNTLYTDSRGRLWVGTSSGGLARYDRSQNNFVRYQTGSNGSNRANVRSITGDGGGGVWIVADDGLDHVDGDTGAFTHVQLAPDATGRRVQATTILRTPDGALWVGTELGLERGVPNSLEGNGRTRVRFERFPLPVPKGASTEVSSLFHDREDRIWVGTQNGVYVLDVAVGNGKGRTVRFVQVKGRVGEMLATKRIFSIAETVTGQMWFGTQDQGILALSLRGDGEGWEARQIAHDPAMPDSLSNDWVNALLLTKDGTMWAGTQRDVSYVNTAAEGAFTLLGGVGKDAPFTDTDIYSIMPRHNGNIWLGLSKNGINILDAEGRKIGELRPQRGVSGTERPTHSLPLGTTPCLAEVADGTIFICNQTALYRTEPSRGGTSSGKAPQITRMPIGNQTAVRLTTILPDHVEGKDVLWIGSNNGLWEIDQNDRVGPARRPILQQPLTDPRVTMLLRGEGDTLWVGTQNGLNKVDENTGAIEKILADPADPSALGAGLIASLLTDKAGRLWVGTFSGGIDILEGRDGKGRPRFHRIIDGLPNENVDTLLNSPDGSIWASTDGGLARIDPVTYGITVLRRAEGARLLAYWNNVGAVTAAGELLFGGSGGMTVVRPKLVKPWAYEPPVVVTHAHIGEYDVPTSRFNSGLDEPPVWIAPDHNDLTVEFSALDYTAPELNHYEYKLEGFDKDWVAADPTRRVARYTNLPPGDYTLLLRGSNRDGLWAPVRQVRVHVIPAWHQTWWFTVLVALVSLLVLFGLFLLATAYLRRQQHELERQVARRTAELHQMTVELQDSQRKLEHMAYSDSLTNLPNRRMFTEHFRQLLAMKLRQGGGFALLLIDFDRFKEINDTFGHDAGDAVLQELARRMSENVRASDCFARLGGDEFGLLLAETPGGDGLDTVCAKILESFEAPVEFDGVKLKTTPSIGVALFPEDGETQDKLYKAADMALYQAKRNGGNGMSWQRPELRRL